MKKALIAMSGGVDSAVAAYLMSQKGYECTGITMKLYDNDTIQLERGKTCCSADDIADARFVASKLNIPYYVFNFKDDFDEKVIKKFVETYEQGGTPNPCIDCNRYIKFERLMQRMKEIQYDYVVTGHYADVVYENSRYRLKKGVDATKDQSYVLYSLTQEQLAHTLFPLGNYSKKEIRKIAQEQGFINADKPDSQDICFVPNGDYATFIEGYTHKKYKKGNFIDKNGKVLGTHNGLIRYTIGQRKGLGLAVGEPVYVCSKDMDKNTVIVGSNEDLFVDSLYANDFNWISETPSEEISCSAKTRYNMKEQPCTAQVVGDKVLVKFINPVRAVTKGQAVVLYDGEYVLGGGTII